MQRNSSRRCRRFHLRWIVLIVSSFALVSWGAATFAGPFAPAAGQPGSEAIAGTSPDFVAWATGFENLVRGPLDIANPAGGDASFGSGSLALGPSVNSTADVVSLGDGGQITLTFAQALTNGPGFDFAVFENGFADNFIELAFVEVSSNGTDFFRFDSVSLTQTATQVGGFDPLDPTDIDNLAGKYRVGFGTPFDLEEMVGVSGLLDPDQVTHVRLIDVVGSIDPALATQDSLGNTINDPYSTPFASGGFDLEAVGAIYVVPEPSTGILLLIGWLAWFRVARRR